MFELLPLAIPLCGIGVILTSIFFITSSDSGSMVVDSITSGGKLDPPVGQLAFWCIAEGAVAALLLLGGGLRLLQAASLISGFPIAIIFMVIAVGIWMELRCEAR